jgi:hypothetical protein
MNRGTTAGERIRELAERKLPDIETLIERAEAIKAWLEVATTCDCETVDVCSLFTDPALAPPAASRRGNSEVTSGSGRGSLTTSA